MIMSEWLQLVSPIVSLGGATVATYFALRQARYTRENFRIQLGTDLLKWGNEVIDLLSETESICFHRLDTEAQHIALKIEMIYCVSYPPLLIRVECILQMSKKIQLAFKKMRRIEIVGARY
jgi:hypothetical protein